MSEKRAGDCSGSCLICGRCFNFPILDEFKPFYKPRSRKYPRKHLKLRGYGIAVDLGTTTIVLALLEPGAGKIIARHSFVNPQLAYGADVISRINSANNGSLKKMQCAVSQSIIDGIGTMLETHEEKKRQNRTGLTGLSFPSETVIAGNTTMIHLLFGLSYETLGIFPFKPEYSLKDTYTYDEIFAHCNPSLLIPDTSLIIHIIPWFSAFAGGDILAGLLSVMPSGIKKFILVDLGTNGEIALFHDGNVTVTSAAAGPAFDNAAQTIGEMARLIREGEADGSGLLKSCSQGIFTQKKVRDLQLAKSAVRSGIEILLKDAGMNYDSLDALFLAGGLGQAMNAEDAQTIALIPKELSGKTRAVGNSSLAGAVRLMLSPDDTVKDMQTLLKNAKEINLAEDPRFNDMFARYMFF